MRTFKVEACGHSYFNILKRKRHKSGSLSITYKEYYVILLKHCVVYTKHVLYILLIFLLKTFAFNFFNMFYYFRFSELKLTFCFASTLFCRDCEMRFLVTNEAFNDMTSIDMMVTLCTINNNTKCIRQKFISLMLEN